MQLEAAYFAGFFDGEGSVYAASRGGRGRSANRRPSPTIAVCITNTNLEVLEWHRKLFGGSISAKRRKARWRQQYQWMLWARDAGRFLALIRPFLIVKADVVDAALEYIALQALPAAQRRDYSNIVERNGRKRCAPVIRPEFQERQLAVWARIRELNARGAPYNARRRRLALEDMIEKRRTAIPEAAA